MSFKKRKRKQPTPWKVVRRCVVFFATICIIPVVLVLLITTDLYMRPIRTGGRDGMYRPDVSTAPPILPAEGPGGRTLKTAVISLQ